MKTIEWYLETSMQGADTIEWYLETSMRGADWSGDFEVDDVATDAEIDAIVREEVFNIISWGWSERGK